MRKDALPRLAHSPVLDLGYRDSNGSPDYGVFACARERLIHRGRLDSRQANGRACGALETSSADRP